MPHGQPHFTDPQIRLPSRSRGVGGMQAGAETPTNLGTSLDMSKIFKLLGGLGLGGLFGSSLLKFGGTQFPEFELPEQEFGREEAGLLSGRLGSRLRSTGFSAIERGGIDTPSRLLGVQGAATSAENEALAQLLSGIDQSNLQRSLAQFQTGSARQQRKGDIAGTIGDIAGMGSALLFPGLGQGIKGVSSIFKGLFG